MSEEYKPIPCNQYTDLFEKINSIETGYENFCIQKETLKLLPFKDFDFIGKKVVCLKCYQKFPSKMSYKAHVGTDICIKIFNGPNLVYLKYKNIKSKSLDYLIKYVKKVLLIPEMLNTLQTRNNCYPDNIIHQRKKVKKKQINSSDKTYDSSTRKPRGRPKKIIDSKPKNLGRLGKFNDVTSCSTSQSDNSIDNNLENDVSGVKTIIKVTVGGICNVNVTKEEELQYIMDWLTDRFWNLMGLVLNIKTIIGTIHKNPDETQNIIKEFSDLLITNLLDNENEIIIQLESLEPNIQFLIRSNLSNQVEEKIEFSNELELVSMLYKLIDIRKKMEEQKLKKTAGMNDVSTNIKRKENIKSTITNNEGDTGISEKDNGVSISSSTITVVLNSSHIDDESMEYTDINESESEPTSQDNIEEIIETITEDVPSNSNNSVINKLNVTDYPLISVRKLVCRYCSKKFASIAEWKKHNPKHLFQFMTTNKFFCKICGHKFEVHENFTEHLNEHVLKNTKIHLKSFKCGVCHEQFDYLRSYFNHKKTYDK